MNDSSGSGGYADATLQLFLQRFIEGRLALLVTDSLTAVRFLKKKAASLEVLYTQSVFESDDADEGVHFTPLPGESEPFPFETACFGAVIVPRIEMLGRGGVERIVSLFELLDEDGVMVVGTSSTESPEGEGGVSTAADGGTGYRQLFRTLTEHFGSVRVLGQSPFVGTSIYDLAEVNEETEISFDGTLVEGERERPIRVLLVCSRDEISMDPFTVLQAPAKKVFTIEPPRARETEGRVANQERHAQEVGRLEKALQDCGKRIGELEREVNHRSALLRDLMEKMRGMNSEAPEKEATEGEGRRQQAYGDGGAQPGMELEGQVRNLRRELDGATARAVEAEAARVEAILRLDEVSGFLSTAGTEKPDAVDSLERERAALLGKVRGLGSLVAELEESRGAAEARLVLAHHDLDEARERSVTLERELEESREHLELELARAGMSRSNDIALKFEEERAVLEGEKAGLKARCLDVERSVEELFQLRQKLQASLREAESRAAVAENRAGSLREALEEAREQLFSLTEIFAGGGEKARSPESSGIKMQDTEPGLAGETSGED